MFERLRHHDSIDAPLRRNGTFAKGEFLKWYEKQEKQEAHPWRQRTKKIAGKTALLAAGVAVMAGNADIVHNKEIQAESTVTISVRGEALDIDNNDQSIVMLSGYGSLNANYITDKLGSSIQPVIDGQLWSVDYANATLDATVIANEIIDTAEQSGVDTVTLVGHSIGGITALQVADVLTEQPAVRVQAIIPISTPDGYEGLQPSRQDQLNLTWLLDVFPDLIYSTPFRIGTEIVFRYDQYNSGNLTERIVNLFQTSQDVSSKVINRELPGNWLINDQFLALQNAKLDQRLESIGDAASNILDPVIIYIGTDGHDETVNEKTSSENISEYSQLAGLQYLHLAVPDLTHNTPWQSAEEINQTLMASSPVIQQLLGQNLRNYSINNLWIVTPVHSRR